MSGPSSTRPFCWNLRCRNKDPRLHAGLDSAELGFTERSGDRETAPNFLIVISGGKSTNPHKTQAMIAPLSRRGVRFYANGVGTSTN
ncbi:hypothetical protein RRG08_052836 [Elysia crispata]|uniref:VWFA domain-containing protein n=1 Tax=Elysia crispata TaxID=231223 RepID=A0AAE1A4M4_9GAST|nr:hypothetical protein RRG08_052836 [Elysia crispata]